MNNHWLDHGQTRLASPVQGWPAAVKLGGGLIIICGTVLLPLSWVAWFLGVAIFLAIIILISRVPIGFLLRRLLVLCPFVLGVALLNALQPAARATFLGIALKSLLCLITVILVSNTTPFSEILQV